MAASLLALLDDITLVLDDVAALTKIAAKKTAGVLGDDLALNAKQVSGVRSNRELPVVWAVSKGSMINKLILVPAALAISAVAPWLIMPLLMIGGAFLCFEGAEKLVHKFFPPAEHEAHIEKLHDAVMNDNVDMVQLERDKIKGAVRTDFILSAEIIAIVLGTVAEKPLMTQAMVLSVIAVAMTVFVYGLVAFIVKIDDIGLALSKGGSTAARGLGRGLVWSAPVLMKILSVVGTAAMFLVGGGILVHGAPWVHGALDAATSQMMFITQMASVSATGSMWGDASTKAFQLLYATFGDGVTGLMAGLLLMGVVSGGKRIWGSLRKTA